MFKRSRLLATLTVLFIVNSAEAGRPLITDDAGVVAHKQGQLETWGYSDKRSFQHWVSPTIGLGHSIEISASAVQGITNVKGERGYYALSGPILQSKVMVFETLDNGTPGLAIAGGVIPPFGKGLFRSLSWEYYFYAALSSKVLQSDKLLLHINFGRQTRKQLDNSPSALLWGAALEFQTMNNQYVFVEAANGEVYSLIPGIASQLGIRHEVKEGFQLDGSVGTGLTGNPRLPFWVTLGCKFVTELWD